jgi:uncharacterized protein YeaO (DUF488 family)
MHLAPMIRPDHIKLKRAYETLAPDDGTRILMDRLWPRRIELKREFEIMRSQPKDSTGRMEHPID